jgi:5-oxoprolinase (ATP-hydrolysing)
MGDAGESSTMPSTRPPVEPSTMPSTMPSIKPPIWRFWIDRGGTFTDCIGVSPEGTFHTTKVLSSDQAPVEAIREIIALSSSSATFDARTPTEIKLGTTVATNALLERRGVPTLLVTNEGLAGVFVIGTQERPELFELEIEKPSPLPSASLEVAGRRDASGAVVEALDPDTTRAMLASALVDGVSSVAIVCMHAHVDPTDEIALAGIARDLGFDHVVGSHELSREIGLLSRGETAIVDAYLTPLLRGHLADLHNELPGARLRLMQSSGGLTEIERFRGPNALLSGPAGGVVAAQRVARDAGHRRAIGFDMGGTSTDVSLVEETLDRTFETEVGGVRVKAPMLRIHTVAAGGGSLCRFDGMRLTVGPESAGSDPGPLCYGRTDREGEPRASELTVTDINLALGRVAADRFPFGLERAPVDRALADLRERLDQAGFERSLDDVAAGFFEIANANMAQAIAEVSVSRGVDPRDHVLVGFGGAGGQHVCAIAKRLGVSEILLHPYAGLLSAYGIGIAELSWDGERDGLGRSLPEEGALDEQTAADWSELEALARAALGVEGVGLPQLSLERSLDLGYIGSDTALAIAAPTPAAAASEWREAFESAHRERFGYVRTSRSVEIKAVRVHAVGAEAELPLPVPRERPGAYTSDASAPSRLREVEAWFPGVGRVTAPVFAREALFPGDRLSGPALVLESTGTVVLDPGFDLAVDARGVFRLSAIDTRAQDSTVDLSEADPVRLEVLGNRFMSIAEQMGAVLRNTAVSTNIKERLDYSCAVFDREGGLVANAPHIPVHLGAMADTVQAMRERFEPFDPEDVIVTNDPFAGGSHLPDVTVVTPVFLESESLESGSGRDARPSFYVASRGHHADLGGMTPGSMPAHSTRIEEEGVLIEPFRLVRDGVFQEEAIRRVLGSGRFPARRPDDNVADLEAMVASNRAGAALLDRLVRETGEDVVQVTMQQLQTAVASKVARELARLPPGEHRFEDALDDGTPIVVRLEVESARDDASGLRMCVDFEGTGPASSGNLNAPRAVVHAAVLYVLRSLVAERIPLNGGCLDPIDLRIPAGSILDPPPGSAVVGGNVETSQRVVDVLLGALGRAAASQGTMNNVTFGDESFGYYETIGGGAGATAFAPGASGVHTHMTNTRITDPEVLEARFPVRLLEFGLRVGSGGAGRHPGGEGIRRRYLFLRPVTVSLLTERRVRAPFGLEGGANGARGCNRMLRVGTKAYEELPSCAEVAFEAGDELSIETPGGGGFGPA